MALFHIFGDTFVDNSSNTVIVNTNNIYKTIHRMMILCLRFQRNNKAFLKLT